MDDYKSLEENGNVSVDVTKIVKYACISSVLIVSVIFITRCISKILDTKNR